MSVKSVINARLNFFNDFYGIGLRTFAIASKVQAFRTADNFLA